MTSAASPRQFDTSPLLTLPTELKLHIISYLPRERSPILACLRRTHTSFLNLIPKSKIRSDIPHYTLCSQLLETEMHYSYLLPIDHYPCYSCAAVLSVQNFHPNSTQRDYVIGGARAYARSCSQCALENNPGPHLYYWVQAGLRRTRLAQSRGDIPSGRPQR